MHFLNNDKCLYGELQCLQSLLKHIPFSRCLERQSWRDWLQILGRPIRGKLAVPTNIAKNRNDNYRNETNFHKLYHCLVTGMK
jgi:hypothetical protein